MKFHKNIRVGKDDLDELSHVNNVRYVQWIQEISRDHWLSIAPPELQKSVVWVVRRHEIDYRNAAVLGDELRLSTYIADVKGPLSTRVVEMRRDLSGELVAVSRTNWCLLDAISLRPKKISAEIHALFQPEGG